MRRIALELLASVFIALAMVAGLTGAAWSSPPAMVRVIVQFDRLPGASEQRLIALAGGRVTEAFHLVPAVTAMIPQRAVDALRRNARVTLVEEDGLVWAVAETLPWGVDRIDAELVHPYNKGTGVKVAILDTGIDLDHPDLHVVGNVTFVSGTSSGDDDNGHGTHVAGIVAALDNDVGVIGVAPEAALYAVKVLDRNGSGSWSNIIKGLQWAVDNHMQVINMSLGGTSGSSTLKTACDNAYAAGVVVVAAAGNNGNSSGTGDTVLYPARYDSVIAVAATDSADKRASYSSTGPKVELAAPGSNINSTLPGGAYGTKSGTSMASPHVTGVAALVIASGIQDGNGNGHINDEVRQRLQQTADDLGTAGRDSLYGYGLVDADEAAPRPTNQSPIAKAGPDQTVDDHDGTGKETVALDGSASYDPDGTISNYQWLEGNSPLAVGQKPTVDFGVGSHTVTLKVTDDKGATATDNVIIKVNANQPPVAEAGPDQTLSDADNNGTETVAVDGSASYDPDGSIVAYEWKEGTTVLGTQKTLSDDFTAGATHVITLTVKDDGGATATDTVNITVNPYQHLVANAGPDQAVRDTDGNGWQNVTLDGSGSSDAHGIITDWSWAEGNSTLGTGQILMTDFTVGSHTVTLTVTDDGGATATDSVNITVNPNQPPVANAGPDKTVTDADKDGQETVTLDGSASYDPDGSIVAYQWKEGAAVLGTENTLTYTTNVGVHTVTLTVTDNGGATATDDVVIVVKQALTMHVASIQMSLVQNYFGLITYATATVKVVDGNGNVVQGAVVTGHWEIATTDHESGTANSTGLVTFQSDSLRQPAKGTRFVFVVDSVTKDGWGWDSQGSVISGQITVP